MKNKIGFVPAICFVAVCSLIPFAGAWTDAPFTERERALSRMPPLMLWAWERPSALQFIDVRTTGVAFLAATITLRADTVETKPRLQPLTVPRGTCLMPVVRIEVSGQSAALSSSQLDATVGSIIQTTRRFPARALQIDFDAGVRERPFYRRLLQSLRAQLPPSMPISITSLASWCLGDNWLGDLPVDEVVPMFFSMGADRSRMLSYLSQKKDLTDFKNKISIGIAVDEPDVVSALPAVTRRVYLFSNYGWSERLVTDWSARRDKIGVKNEK